MIKAFKREVGNYRIYQMKLKEVNADIEIIEYQMAGLTGVDPAKERNAYNPEFAEYHRLDMIERLSSYQKEKMRIVANLNHVDDVLSKMEKETADAIMKIYADGHSLESVARSLYLSKSGLEGRIDRAIKKSTRTHI